MFYTEPPTSLQYTSDQQYQVTDAGNSLVQENNATIINTTDRRQAGMNNKNIIVLAGYKNYYIRSSFVPTDRSVVCLTNIEASFATSEYPILMNSNSTFPNMVCNSMSSI